MKRPSVLLPGLAAALITAWTALPSAAAAREMVAVHLTDVAAVFLDRHSIEKGPDGVRASETVLYAEPIGEGPERAAYSVKWSTFDCKGRRSRTDRMVGYSAAGEALVRVDDAGEWLEARPQTTGANALDLVCEGRDNLGLAPVALSDRDLYARYLQVLGEAMKATQ